jgi:hypothetical protein
MHVAFGILNVIALFDSNLKPRPFIVKNNTKGYCPAVHMMYIPPPSLNNEPIGPLNFIQRAQYKQILNDE